MSRSYRNVRPHGAKVYSVGDVQELYLVCRNTVSNWVRSGLKPSDDSNPQLFRGAELKRFHTERAARTRQYLRVGEFKCVGCGNAVFPCINTVSLQHSEGRVTVAWATCCDCGASMMKLLSATERDKIGECLTTNTELVIIDEGEVPVPARIGTNAGSQEDEWFGSNDRLIHDWQAYAGRYCPKTEQAHLVSIRDFERFLGGIHFNKVKPKHAGEFRDHLVRQLCLPKEAGGLSNSTIRHRASHLAAFFEWLRGQDGFRRLSSGIPAYFALPRSAAARHAIDDTKDYPTLDDAWRMVEAMPRKTVIQRRDRAMVAFAFISGLRAATLTALRLKHLDQEAKAVWQDAREVPAKNGKSYRATWFPRTEAFQAVFLSWVEELGEFGFQPHDALFPDAKYLRLRTSVATPIAPLRSSKPLQAAFAYASSMLGVYYTPHAARHTLKAFGAQMCRSHEQRKAWSMNLGHSDEQITERHYGKMSQSRSRELINALSSDQVFTEEENELIIDYYQQRFQRGTAEYAMARKLAEKREMARGGFEVVE